MKRTERAEALSYTLSLANEYVREHAPLSDKSKRPSYHLTPEIGWMNDPNGFCSFGGKYHLFWQYNPFEPKWNSMYWGHAATEDFVKWEYLPVALAPDKPYDWGYGCFSGSARAEDGKLYLLYTGVDENAVQQQCLAFSSDGVHFEKYERNPVIPSSKLPEVYPIKEFRDPFLFRRGDRYYALIGTKTELCGNILLYRSKDMKRWKYVGALFGGDEGGLNKGVYECPALFEADGKDVLMYSAQFLPSDGNRFVNIHSSVYLVGKLDLTSGKFNADYMGETDGGFDFYALQTVTAADGRTVMTAWMQMWDRDYVTESDGFVGSMILPRELVLKDGKLYQYPVREIENYRREERRVPDLVLDEEEKKISALRGTQKEIQFKLDTGTAERAGIRVFSGKDCALSVYYDRKAGTVTLDRGTCGKLIRGAFPETNFATRSVRIASDGNGVLSFRLFLDRTGAEVFLNDGAATITANVYPDREAENASFFAEGGSARFFGVVGYEIEVK